MQQSFVDRLAADKREADQIKQQTIEAFEQEKQENMNRKI